MTLSIFILGLSFAILALSYISYRSVRSAKRLIQQIGAYEAELAASKSIERSLRDEITSIRNQLQNSFTDPVTGLLGWQIFEDRMRQALKESARHRFNMGIAMVDIDDFKTINDALGYEVADKLLKEVAERISLCVREVDHISRFTKDTFVVMLTQLAKPETAAIVAQRILQAIAMPFQIGEEELHVTACIGVALYPTDGGDIPLLLSRADHALHMAKSEGRHYCRFYEEKLQSHSLRELQLSSGVGKEETFQNFTVYFQPVVDAKTNSIFCLEASVIWQHPQLGEISQVELFQTAEKQRKLNSLSIWMLKQACEQFMKLRQKDESLTMLAIPVSIKQLENSHFIYELSQIMQQLAFDPKWLLIELKEHHTELSFDILSKAFNMLEYLGVRTAIDHFGAHSLSLRYLRVITLHYLKLDGSFVDGIEDNAQALALIKALHYFAQAMSLQLIVTGVGSSEQIGQLSAIGCRLMQGSAFAEPNTLEQMLQKRELM